MRCIRRVKRADGRRRVRRIRPAIRLLSLPNAVRPRSGNIRPRVRGRATQPAILPERSIRWSSVLPGPFSEIGRRFAFLLLGYTPSRFPVSVRWPDATIRPIRKRLCAGFSAVGETSRGCEKKHGACRLIITHADSFILSIPMRGFVAIISYSHSILPPFILSNQAGNEPKK
jgi:hypothetical protein